MTFLNLLLLGGTATAVVPLIIHLLNRSRFKVVDWGAMHLLESALKINSRRIQWQAWLLLLLRMMIPALLAICLARPVLTAWRTVAGGAQHSVVFILDNSLSMQADAARPRVNDTNEGSGAATSTTRNASCFDVALQEIQTLMERFGSTTEWTILTSGGGVVDQTNGATFDIARVTRRLREIRVGAGPGNMNVALEAGLNRLAKARQVRRHLIVLSDFQRSEWESLAPENLATLKEASDAVGTPIETTWIPIPSQTKENLSVQIDRPAGASVVAYQQPLEVRVAVRNHGRTRVKDLPVVLTADGVSLASKNVDIAGDSQVFLVFNCQLQTLGTHDLMVSVDETKGRQLESSSGVVTADDQAHWSVQVIEPVQVAVVSNRPPQSRSIDDAVFLNLAMSPYAVSLVGGSTNEETAGWAEAMAGADPIRCEVVPPNQLTDNELAHLQTVVLANIPALDDSTSKRLRQFVNDGGLLMICAGDAIDASWYNKQWGLTSAQPLLAIDYGAISRPAGRPNANIKIQSKSYDHPALTLFNRSSNGRLDSVDFNTWYRPATVEKPASAESNSAVLTLLSLENGDPLLLERTVGKGKVLQWTTSCADRWSNLPLREIFVPLIQQLVLTGATSGTPQLNLDTGSPLAVQWARATSPATTESSKKSKDKKESKEKEVAAKAPQVELMTPGGARYRLDPQSSSDQWSVQFTDTQFPGVYRVDGVSDQPLLVSCSVPVAESNLTELAQSNLSTLAERMDAQVHSSANEFWSAEQVKQTGREIWRWLLLGVLLCLFAELLLQQSLTRTPT